MPSVNDHFEKKCSNIVKQVLDGNISNSHVQISRFANELKDYNEARAFIIYLGNLLIVSSVKEKVSSNVLMAATKEIFKHSSGTQDKLTFLTSILDTDPEIYQYVKEYPEAELFDDTWRKIDIDAVFDKNIEFLRKYNKKVLNYCFEGGLYSQKYLSLPKIQSAFESEEALYYRINHVWHKINLTGEQSLEIKPNKYYARTIYQFSDLSYISKFILQHSKMLLKNKIMKVDRYLTISHEHASLLLQILPFSNIENGSYHVRLLIDSHWKRWLRCYALCGYVIPNDVIADQNRVSEINTYLKLLTTHVEIVLSQNRIDNLKLIYTKGYLSRLRQKNMSNSDIRVMILTSRHSTYIQYSSEELCKGFRAIGCKAIILRERINQGMGFTTEFLLRVICRYQPHMIICINNFRPGYLYNFVPELPFLCWIQDFPQTLPRSPFSSILESDFIFSSTKKVSEELPEHFPVLKNQEIHFLPCVRYIENYQETSKIQSKKYDVGYIANLNVIPEIISYYEPEKQCGSNLEKMIHLFINRLETCQPYEIAEVIMSGKKCYDLAIDISRNLDLSFNPPLSINSSFINSTLQQSVGHFLQKTLPIRYLINRNYTNIFLGGMNWDKLRIFRPFAKGYIEHSKLNEAINNIAINLNLSAVLSFHPKVGEVLATGSFVMSSWKGENGDGQPITDFFLENEEVVLFKSYSEMVEKISYYLSHDTQRRQITERARKKFVRNFSSQNGCKKILSIVLDRNRSFIF